MSSKLKLKDQRNEDEIGDFKKKTTTNKIHKIDQPKFTDNSPEKVQLNAKKINSEQNEANKIDSNNHLAPKNIQSSVNHSINHSSYMESDSMLVCGTEFVDMANNPEFILQDAEIDPRLEKRFRDKETRKNINKNLQNDFEQPIQELESEYNQKSNQKSTSSKDYQSAQKQSQSQVGQSSSSIKKKNIKFTPSSEILQARRRERFQEQKNSNMSSINSMQSQNFINLQSFDSQSLKQSQQMPIYQNNRNQQQFHHSQNGSNYGRNTVGGYDGRQNSMNNGMNQMQINMQNNRIMGTNLSQNSAPISNLTLEEQQQVLGQMNPGLMMKMMQDMMPFFISNNPKVIQITHMNKQLQAKVQMLQNQLNEANIKCQQAIVQNNELQRMTHANTNSQQAQIQQLEMALNHHKEENSRLRNEVDNLNQELTSSRSANMSENQTISHLQNQLESKRENIQVLQQRIDNLNNENIEKSNQVSNLKLELDKLQYKQNFSQDKKEELEKQIQRKSNQLEMFEKGEVRLKEELQKLRNEYDNIKAQNITFQGDLTNAQDRLLQQERENTRLLNKMNTFEKLCLQLEEKERDLIQLRNNYEGVQSQYLKLKNDFEVVSQDLQTTKDRLHDFKMEKNRLMDEIESSKRVSEDAEFQFKRSKRDYEGQIRRLQDEIDILSTQKKAMVRNHQNTNLPTSPPTYETNNPQESHKNFNTRSETNLEDRTPLRGNNDDNFNPNLKRNMDKNFNRNNRNIGSNFNITQSRSRTPTRNADRTTPFQSRDYGDFITEKNNQLSDHFSHNHPSNIQLAPNQNNQDRNSNIHSNGGIELSHLDHFSKHHPSNPHFSEKKQSEHMANIEPAFEDHFSTQHPSNPHFEKNRNKSFLSAPYFTHNQQDHFKNIAEVTQNTHNHERYPPANNPITRNYPPVSANEEKNQLRGILRNRRALNNRGNRRWNSTLDMHQTDTDKSSKPILGDNANISNINLSNPNPQTSERKKNLAEQYREELGGKEAQRVEIESQLLQLQMQKDNVSHSIEIRKSHNCFRQRMSCRK